MIRSQSAFGNRTLGVKEPTAEEFQRVREANDHNVSVRLTGPYCPGGVDGCGAGAAAAGMRDSACKPARRSANGPTGTAVGGARGAASDDLVGAGNGCG